MDLHRHLDGNLRLETVLELALARDLELPAFELEALRPHLQIVEPEADLAGFLSKVELMASVLFDYDACWRVAHENVEDARGEGLDYGDVAEIVGRPAATCRVIASRARKKLGAMLDEEETR